MNLKLLSDSNIFSYSPLILNNGSDKAKKYYEQINTNNRQFYIAIKDYMETYVDYILNPTSNDYISKFNRSQAQLDTVKFNLNKITNNIDLDIIKKNNDIKIKNDNIKKQYIIYNKLLGKSINNLPKNFTTSIPVDFPPNLKLEGFDIMGRHFEISGNHYDLSNNKIDISGNLPFDFSGNLPFDFSGNIYNINDDTSKLLKNETDEIYKSQYIDNWIIIIGIFLLIISLYKLYNKNN